MRNAVNQANQKANESMTNIKNAISKKLPTLRDIYLGSTIPKGLSSKKTVDIWITLLAKNFLMQTSIQLTNLLLIDDPTSFFARISLLSGQSVNVINYLPFIDNINKFNSMDKSRFFYYDNILLVNMSNLFNSIYTFNSISRQQRSMTVKNYNIELEKNGFFDSIEKIAEILSMQENTKQISSELLKINTIKYPTDLIKNYDFIDSNIAYYKELQNILIPIIDNNVSLALNETNIQAEQQKSQVNNENIVYFGGAINNISYMVNNLTNTLVDEFVILCSSLTETASQIQKTPTDFNAFLNNFKTIMVTAENSNEIQTYLRNFLENSSNAINKVDEELFTDNIMQGGDSRDRSRKWQERKNITTSDRINERNIAVTTARTSEIQSRRYAESLKIQKGNYFSVYIFLSSLYYEPPTDLDKQTVYQEIINKLIGNDNTWRNDKYWQEKYYEFVTYLFDYFCPEYLTSDYMKYVGSDYYLLLKYCFKIRSVIKADNVVLMIFVFFQNYLKYIIGIKTNQNSDLGYYPGLLTEFHTDQAAHSLFKKLKFIDDGLNKSNISTTQTWEFEQNKLIYANFSTICFHLLVYIVDPEIGISSLNAVKLLVGGKASKTIKKRNKKDKTKRTKFNKHKRTNKKRKIINRRKTIRRRNY